MIGPRAKLRARAREAHQQGLLNQPRPRPPLPSTLPVIPAASRFAQNLLVRVDVSYTRTRSLAHASAELPTQVMHISIVRERGCRRLLADALNLTTGVAQ